MLTLTKSAEAFEAAKQVIPGGVNSPVRSFRGVGGTPPFIARAAGSRVFDIDGNEYIDYVGSWGPMILGHAHPAVTKALQQAVELGTSYGAPTIQETELARRVLAAYPSMDMVRMVNSGTEATMSALRVARGYTNRSKIVKFAGCYHGHHDSLLVKAGSGATTLGVPDSPGVPASVAGDTITADYNDAEGLAAIFAEVGEQIAAVIIEPTPGNMGLVLPLPGYLQQVREITRKYGAVLIFDEVMSGFRAAYGGSQGRYGIDPDMTCLGKVIGGGLPVGAYGGKRPIMEKVAPAGPVYQAGTLSGNPLAMAAGNAALEILAKTPNLYQQMEERTKALCAGMAEQAARCGLHYQFHQLGSMFTAFFTEQNVYDYDSARTSDTAAFGRFFHAMLEQGVYLGPSQFETGFVSIAHSDEDIDKTVAAARKAFEAAAKA